LSRRGRYALVTGMSDCQAEKGAVERESSMSAVSIVLEGPCFDRELDGGEGVMVAALLRSWGVRRSWSQTWSQSSAKTDTEDWQEKSQGEPGLQLMHLSNKEHGYSARTNC